MRMLTHSAPAKAKAQAAQKPTRRVADPTKPALHGLMKHHMAKAKGMGLASAALGPKLMEPQTWAELRAIQTAIFERYVQHQQNWTKGCAAIAQEAKQIGEANTNLKLVEQQMNVMAQWGRLISSQATNFMVMQEQIETEMSYWVSKKLT
jgi:hypothetical protein